MNNSQIFTAAHKRARALSSNFGTYAKRLSISLKVEYRVIKLAKADLAKKAQLEADNARLLLTHFELKESRKNEQPTSCYLSVFSWERQLGAA